MGKKEPSKGRQWEKGRRDILNLTFQELYKVLPSYSDGTTISKKTILTQAVSYIQELELLKKSCKCCNQPWEKESVDKTTCLSGLQSQKSASLVKWTLEIVHKIQQLASLLKATGVSPPQELLSFEAPPVSSGKLSQEIVSEIEKIGLKESSIPTQLSKTPHEKKVKSDGKSKLYQGSSVTSKSSFICDSSIPKKCAGEETKCATLKKVNDGVVQPSAPASLLPSQIVFTPNATNSTMTTSLPLLVSVTGVKTVNPLILVQSNVMAPSPSLVYTHQRSSPSCSKARPIKPGPPSKVNKKLKKVPIPSLRQKSLLPINVPLKSCAKRLDSNPNSSSNVLYCDFSPKKNKKTVKSKSLLKSASRKKSKVTCLENVDKIPDTSASKICSEVQDHQHEECSGVDMQREVEACNSALSVMHNSYGVPEIDKENVALNGGASKIDCDSSKAGSYTPFSTSTCNIVQEKVDYASSADIEKSGKCSSQDSLQQSVMESKVNFEAGCMPSGHVAEEINVSAGQKRAPESDISVSSLKRSKCNTSSCSQDALKTSSSLAPESVLHPEAISSNLSSKSSKSNYSISALCAQQQHLIQQSEASCLQGEVPLETVSNKNSVVQGTRQVICDSRSNVSSLSEPLHNRNPQGNCLTDDKSKELSISSTDQYMEWPVKSKSKGDRSYPNYSLFSNFAVQSNKNMFIPINEMENYKSIPDSFDSAENSFGLPLNSSDISGDIFASLQVPPGGQHPESISPTAAFLLAFPLVSSSKATELLTDDAVCENTDSQSGIKTILQIGNLDSDTPVTKCVSVFSATSADSNSITYSAPNVFSSETLVEVLPKSKCMDTSEIDFAPKGHNMASSKSQSDSLKQSFTASRPEGPLVKDSNQLKSGNGSKQACQTRNSSSGVASSFSSVEVQSDIVEASRGQEKNLEKSGSLVSSSSNSIQKAPSKVRSNSNSVEASPFMTFQKQQNWSEVSATSQAYADFASNNTRTDCAVNFPAPTITSLTNSSSANGDAVSVVSGSSYKVQPSLSNNNGSILSWSTISSPENTLSAPGSKSHKLAPFQDSFSSTKVPDKQDQSHSTSVLCSLGINSEPTYSQQLGGASGFQISDKVSSNIPHFNQDPNINMKIPPSTNTFGHSLDQKQATTTLGFSLSTKHSSMLFPPLEKVVDPKKGYLPLAENKQSNTICNTSESTKVSLSTVSNLDASHPHAHQPQQMRNNSPHVSPSGLFSTASDDKIKPREIPCNQSSVIGTKNCMNHVQSSKHSSIENFSQNSTVPVPKSAGSVTLYEDHSGTALKGPLDHNPSINMYEHEINREHKHNTAMSNSLSNTSALEHKKDASLFNHHVLTSVQKQVASVPNYSMNSSNSSLHYNENSLENVHNQQQTYKIIGHDSREKQQASVQHHQLQQRQSHEQLTQQSCVRSNKESSSNMMHRPPVNWMTAPDIRSHQHHNGPSFGNGSNVGATQGILYLPDSENGASSSLFDSSCNFHCIDIAHSGQSFYKGNELLTYGNDGIENIHENSSWSPNKSGSVLGNMLIPSTLPTLVGDLALGDNSISRPFLHAFNNTSEVLPCPKKTKRIIPASKREKAEDINVNLNPECPSTFLSVSQLVDSGNASKTRNIPSSKESIPCISHFPEQSNTMYQALKQFPKSVSSNYSAEALLSSPSTQQSNQAAVRKRRTPGAAQYHNNYVTPSTSFHSSNNNTLQSHSTQTQCVPDVSGPRANDYHGTFIHSDTVPSFMISSSSRSQKNHSYNMTNVAERLPPIENQSNSERGVDPTAESIEATGSAARQRTANSSSTVVPSSSSNLLEFGYINMQPSMLSEDLSFSNHHPPPPFLTHHTYTAQDALYPTPRLPMHSHHHSQNNNVQSPSATTLTNFHLSTIFPEINEKVIC